MPWLIVYDPWTHFFAEIVHPPNIGLRSCLFTAVYPTSRQEGTQASLLKAVESGVQLIKLVAVQLLHLQPGMWVQMCAAQTNLSILNARMMQFCFHPEALHLKLLLAKTQSNLNLPIITVGQSLPRTQPR